MFKPVNPKFLQQEQGFTLVEVLVSILIATIFVATAMQAMVIAALFKAKAQQYAEATTWIQEDLESVKNRAAQLQNTSLRTAAAAGSTALEVTSIDGFQAGDSLLIGTGSTSRTIASGGVNTTTKTITLNSPGLATAQPIRAAIVATTRCNAASQNTGFAAYLRSNLPTIVSDGIITPANSNQGSRRITGRTYLLTRYGTDATSTQPGVTSSAFERLQLKYEVKPDGGGDAIATIYTEVVPDAAFQCP